MRVEVRNGNVDQAIRVLKKKLQQDGLFNELREREFYMSRSEKRRRSKAAAIRRQIREEIKREEEAYGGQTKKNRR
jgi:small subunit ribosomal protein S21